MLVAMEILILWIYWSLQIWVYIVSALDIKAWDLGEIKKLDLTILPLPLPGAKLGCRVLVPGTH